MVSKGVVGVDIKRSNRAVHGPDSIRLLKGFWSGRWPRLSSPIRHRPPRAMTVALSRRDPPVASLSVSGNSLPALHRPAMSMGDRGWVGGWTTKRGADMVWDLVVAVMTEVLVGLIVAAVTAVVSRATGSRHVLNPRAV